MESYCTIATRCLEKVPLFGEYAKFDSKAKLQISYFWQVDQGANYSQDIAAFGLIGFGNYVPKKR